MLTRTTLAVCVCLALLCCATSAQIPQKLNYQAMVTDDADQPLANQTVSMTFTIYDAESGGTALWSETQSPTTNAIGVVSVVLGSASPIDCSFDAPRWLEIEIDGQVLSPRRELVTSPYAGRAATAENSDRLGDIEASEYALLDDIGALGDGHSLDAADGSPVDALYVDTSGNVKVGESGDGRSLYVGGTSATNASVSVQDGLYGGEIALRDEAGILVGWLKSDESTGGGGRFELARNDEGMLGFKVDGNYSATEEPQVRIVGSSRQVLFDMRNEGNASVALPDDAIDDQEIRNEPGVGSIQAAPELDLNPGNVTTIASRTIDCPSSGYVFVMGTAELTMYLYDTSGTEVTFGISKSINAWSGEAQENTIRLIGALPGGWYHAQAVAQGMFEVSAGNNTFHMNAREVNGDIRVSGRQLSVMFFPTAYGSVDTTD